MKEVNVKVSGDEFRVKVSPEYTAGETLSKLGLDHHLLKRPTDEDPDQFFYREEKIFTQIKDGQILYAVPRPEARRQNTEEEMEYSPGVPDRWYLLNNLQVRLSEAARVSGLREGLILKYTQSGHIQSCGYGEYFYTPEQIQKAVYISVFAGYGYDLRQAAKKAEQKIAEVGWGSHQSEFREPVTTWKLLVEEVRHGLRDTFREVITNPQFQQILFEEIMEYPQKDTDSPSQGGDRNEENLN
ncbi:hypothetical protein KGY79_10130 [Candidatus Bipolaricaulota bacterium]|nr:hypothetical protein [Candidatus Bipolaricaulota bacterium]